MGQRQSAAMSLEGAVRRSGRVFSEHLAQFGLEHAGFRGRAVGFDDYRERRGSRHAHWKATHTASMSPRPDFPLDARAAARDSHAVDDNDVISTMTKPSPPPPLLEARNVQKHFGRVVALREGNFTLRPNEVHALVGDNGAGKSTLVKILSGVYQADAGEIAIDGRPVTITNPREARELGIETVYQDLALAAELDPAANLYLGRELMRSGVLGRLGFLDKGEMRRRSDDQFHDLGVAIQDTRSSVATMSGGQRQGIAVSRAITWASKVVFMDEPTAALGVVQTRNVLDLILRVRDRGLAVVLISHNMPEVLEVSDRIEVLRLGERVARFRRGDVTIEELVGAMTGAIRHSEREDQR